MSVIIASGNLGKDAELKTIPSGHKVLEFSIPDTVGFGKNKKTQWLECAMFGLRAEKIAQYMLKGTPVQVTGNPSINSYEGKSGFKSELKISVLDVELLKGVRREGSSDTRPVENFNTVNIDDQIPF